MSNTVVNTNVAALNSHRALTSVGIRQARSSERLSTGQRINRASDDAAGLAISEKMRAQIRGLDQAERNSQDGISLVQVAEGALQEIQDIVQRMRELTVQAANDTLDIQDREAIQLELVELSEEIEMIIERTEFNGIPLLENDLTESSVPDTPITIMDLYNGPLTNAERNNYRNFWEGQLGNAPALMDALRVIASGAGMAGYDTASLNALWEFALDDAWGIGVFQALNGAAQVIFPGQPAWTVYVNARSAFMDDWLATRNAAAGGGAAIENEIFIQNGSNAEQSLVLTLPNFNTMAVPSGPLVDLVNNIFTMESHASISARLDDIDAALNEISTYRANLGATQNRLEHTINNLQIASENTSAAESRIRDTDVAREMMEHTQANILQQAATSMLAQANQAPQTVLQLLQ